MSLLEIRNATKKFGSRTILNAIDFDCTTGEIIGIFGRNGAGKSTLLKMIFGIVKADSLDVKFDTQPIPQNKVIHSQTIGYLPQHSFLPKDLKVRSVIPLFFSNGDRQDKVFYAPQVSSFENIQIGKLSLGQLRYLELLLIGNLEHQFLMLDEPFSMVEPLYKEVIKTQLMEIKKTKGIILTDHYYTDVLEISDKNYLIKQTEIIPIFGLDDLVKNDYLLNSTLT